MITPRKKPTKAFGWTLSRPKPKEYVPPQWALPEEPYPVMATLWRRRPAAIHA